MLFFFRGRYGPPARITVGVVLIVLGIVVWGRVALVIGVLLAAWGVFDGVRRFRRRGRAPR